MSGSKATIASWLTCRATHAAARERMADACCSTACCLSGASSARPACAADDPGRPRTKAPAAAASTNPASASPASTSPATAIPAGTRPASPRPASPRPGSPRPASPSPVSCAAAVWRERGGWSGWWRAARRRSGPVAHRGTVTEWGPPSSRSKRSRAARATDSAAVGASSVGAAGPAGRAGLPLLPSTATARRRAASGNRTSPVASSESRYSMAWGWPPSSRQARSSSCSLSDPRAGSDFASSKAPERDSGPTWWNVSGGPLARGRRNGWRQVMSSLARCDWLPQLAINSARAGSRTVQPPETGDTLSSKSSRTSRTGTWPRTSSRSRASR